MKISPEYVELGLSDAVAAYLRDPGQFPPYPAATAEAAQRYLHDPTAYQETSYTPPLPKELVQQSQEIVTAIARCGEDYQNGIKTEHNDFYSKASFCLKYAELTHPQLIQAAGDSHRLTVPFYFYFYHDTHGDYHAMLENELGVRPTTIIRIGLTTLPEIQQLTNSLGNPTTYQLQTQLYLEAPNNGEQNGRMALVTSYPKEVPYELDETSVCAHDPALKSFLIRPSSKDITIMQGALETIKHRVQQRSALSQG